MSILVLLTIFINPINTAIGTTSSSVEDFDPLMKDTLQSGPITELPWDNDPDFLEAKEKNDCPNLLAAYKTVLKDPLEGEEFNVHLAADYVCGTVLNPDDVFSQNQKAGPYTTDRGYQKGPTYFGAKVSETVGGGVCKIASTLYNVAVLADLTVVERYNHSMPVPYVPYGQDATVYYGMKDIKFKNTTQGPVLIWAKGIDNVLYIGLYGQSTSPKVEWSHEVLSVSKAPVIYQVNNDLPPDTEKTTHEGMDGAYIHSTITITYSDGTVKTKDMGYSYYNPLPFIIEKSK